MPPTQTYTCDDCGATVSEETDFWFTDWKCPSDIYCLPCGPKHGFPHRPLPYWGEPDTAEEDDHRNEPDEDSPAYEDCDGCGKPSRILTPESDHPNAPWKCEGCSTDPPPGWVYDQVEGWVERAPLPPIVPPAARPAGAPWPDDCPF